MEVSSLYYKYNGTFCKLLVQQYICTTGTLKQCMEKRRTILNKSWKWDIFKILQNYRTSVEHLTPHHTHLPIKSNVACRGLLMKEITNSNLTFSHGLLRADTLVFAAQAKTYFQQHRAVMEHHL